MPWCPGALVPFLICPSRPAPLMVSSCAHARLASLAWPGRGRGRQTPGPWFAAPPCERGPAPPCLPSPIGFSLHLCFPPLPPLKGPNPWFMTLGGGPCRVPSHLLCARSAHRALPPAPTAAAPSQSPVPPLGLCTRPAPSWRAPLPGPPPLVRRSLLTSAILCSLGTPWSQTRSGPASVLRGPKSLHMGIWLAPWETGRVCSPATLSVLPSPVLLDGCLHHLGPSQQPFRGGMLPPLADEN